MKFYSWIYEIGSGNGAVFTAGSQESLVTRYCLSNI